MDNIAWSWDILNLIFLAILPLVIKLLNDLKNFYVELKTDITEHKIKINDLMTDIEDLKDDIKELKELMDSLAYDIKEKGKQ